MKNRLAHVALNATLAALMVAAITACSKPPEVVGMTPATTTVGTEIDDSILTASIKSALLADQDIKSFDLKVETRKGEVQLSGVVDNQKQVERAITVVQGIAGVKSIQNKMSLKGTATTVGNEIDDGVISTKVKAALLGDPDIKSFDIAVETRKGQVQLSGFVDNQTQVDHAISVAQGVEGVRSVRNEMSVKK